MTRKKPGGKKMADTSEAATKPVRLDLEPDVHRLLRVMAAHSDMSMATYARHALEQYLRNEAKELGIKP